MGETSWLFLLVGSFAAVGAAMAVGTLAALLRYQRTGSFPGAEDDDKLSRSRLIALWLRVGVGFVVLGIGLLWLDRSGVL